MIPAPGLVVLVGAGPGDPGLITRAGAVALASAEVVVHDHLIHPRLLDLAPSDALRIFAGKRGGRLSITQDEINRLLQEHAVAGRRVVRLKGGDPFVFGRGAEEAEFLYHHGIPFRIVPGVTAAVGVTAYAGLPITHREVASTVTLATGHDDPESPEGRIDWTTLARTQGTLVVYMGVTRLRAVCRVLIAGGRAPDTPAAMVRAGTLTAQRTVAGTLADLADRVDATNLKPPALLVIGEIVGRREPLAWFERLPLFGRRIVVTRPEEEDDSAARLELLGAEVLHAPTIAIRPIEDFGPLDDAIERLRSFDWLVFTSKNGVLAFFDRLNTLGRDLRAVGHLQLAAIGPATADALRTYHLRADVVPASFRSEGLVEALRDRVRGQRVLLARADRGRTVLKDELAGVAEVEQVAVYQNVDAESFPTAVLEAIEAGTIDWITVTSSAMVERLHALLTPAARNQVGSLVKLASISPVTSEAARRLGWQVAAEATTFTWDGLIDAIVRSEGGSR